MTVPMLPDHDENHAWRARAGELALACAGAFPAEEVARLRDMAALLREGPGALAGLIAPDPARLDALIAADAVLAGVVALFDRSGAGYLLSRGPAGQHLASVILPGAQEEQSAGGDTAGLALLGALALALAEPAPFPAPLRGAPLAQGARLN